MTKTAHKYKKTNDALHFLKILGISTSYVIFNYCSLVTVNFTR